MSFQARETTEVKRGIRSTDLVDNRRNFDRYAVSTDQAWIGWWEGRLYRKAPAILHDISHGGAKLIAKCAPPRRAAIWICVAGTHKTEWVEGVSLEVTRLQDGSAEVRVQFRELCPYAFFEVAVYGDGSNSNEMSGTQGTDPQGRDWW